MDTKDFEVMKQVYAQACRKKAGEGANISETDFCRDYGKAPAQWRVGPFSLNPSLTFRKEKPFTDPTGIGWRSGFIFNPSLIEKDGALYLFYRAAPQKESLSSRIGLAVYTEEKGWEDLSGEPVLYPTERDETYGVEDPKVYRWNGKYYLFYQSAWQPEGEERERILNNTPENWEISTATKLAVSDDLIHWEKREMAVPYEVSHGWSKGAVIPRNGKGEAVQIGGKFLMFVSEGCCGRQQVGYSEDMEHWTFCQQDYLILPPELGHICEVACCIVDYEATGRNMVLDFFYQDNNGGFRAGQALYHIDEPFRQLELGVGGSLAWGGLIQYRGKFLMAQGWDAPEGKQEMYFYEAPLTR